MLSVDTIKLLSTFARYVETSPAVARQIAAAPSLVEVEQLAYQSGFSVATVDLLQDAVVLLDSLILVRNGNGQCWAGSVFRKALALIPQPQNSNASLSQVSDLLCQNEAKVDSFYRLLKCNRRI